MSMVQLQLPESLYRSAQKLAEKDNISLDQFIATAVAEKLSAMITVEELRRRGERASKAKFEAAMAKVPAVPPAEEDRL